ncbi:MAG: GTP-binding protein [Bacillota bacterium]|nr:GTP-binding protein [Bacillota bacterium]
MIKLDIISGFLGVGKTTFIKRVLQAFGAVDEKVVIVVNEFGDIGIDGTLLQQEGYDFYEITKGCLCCSLKGDFTQTLIKIAEEIRPDRVIIEPSGIFVVQEAIELIKQESLADKFKINNLITIVDCLHFIKHRVDIGLFLEQQIQSASKLVLSKVQLIREDDKKEILKQLQEINSTAKVYDEPWDYYDSQDIIEIIANRENEIHRFNQMLDVTKAYKVKHSYDYYGITTDMIFDGESVKGLMRELAKGSYGKVVRSKGVLRGSSNNIEFQYIDGEYSIYSVNTNISTGKTTFIGHEIDKEALEDLFKNNLCINEYRKII